MADVRRSPSAVADELASDDMADGILRRWPTSWHPTSWSPMADVLAMQPCYLEQASLGSSARVPSQMAEGSLEQSARVQST